MVTILLWKAQLKLIFNEEGFFVMLCVVCCVTSLDSSWLIGMTRVQSSEVQNIGHMDKGISTLHICKDPI
jgi:hypothetical protein